MLYAQEALLARRRDARLQEEQEEEGRRVQEARVKRLREIRRQADEVKTRVKKEAALDLLEGERVSLVANGIWVSQVSAKRQPNVSQASAKCRPSVCQTSAKCQPMFD